MNESDSHKNPARSI